MRIFAAANVFNRKYCEMRAKLFLISLLYVLTVSAQMSQTDYAKLKAKTDVYLQKVEAQPDWLLSRLQMFWSTQATDIYIKGETFDHPGGEKAPYPTVKLDGTRSHGTDYNKPKLENVIPYDDDANGCVTMISKATGQMEKVHPSKTGRQISSLNRQIVGIARDAARLYAENKDERYAKMAFGVFDTFLKGIYYRNVPIDLTHSHMQTLVGMVSFEVIHEDVINELTEMYPLLLNYEPCRKNRDFYDTALKKWADVIIPNGVPHNNWDLIQATFVVRIALVLQADNHYTDKKGRDYYLDYCLNQSSLRQWSIKKLADYGFDPVTKIWFESPGYSIGVVKDFVVFADMMDREAGVDVFEAVPIITEAVFAVAQYLFPNRMICGFGDTHPNYISTQIADILIAYADRHGDTALKTRAEAFRKAILPDAPAQGIEQYVSKTFYSPNVSWLMQRTGMDKQHDLAISLNGALGNHQHANGISMELYGKGFVLGPDAGIGKVLYSGDDYKEYYSRFPAHNTVCVDGASDHMVMMSQHPFEVQFLHNEQLTIDNGQLEATVSQVYFLEPETRSDQLRTNGIVKTEHGGYYIDIFRSRSQIGKDKFHDYFYHNLGQTMTLTAADGSDLKLKPTEELAFAGGHLMAYSYIYDKQSTYTDRDVKATFTTTCPDGRKVDMTMWMQGSKDREVFRALSPVNMEYERLGDFMPYKVDEQPVLTYVARQYGDAWTKPFVAVYEPSDTKEPSEIEKVEFFTPKGKIATPLLDQRSKNAVGIKVTLKDGRVDIIVSTPDTYKVTSNDQTLIELSK